MWEHTSYDVQSPLQFTTTAGTVFVTVDTTAAAVVSLEAVTAVVVVVAGMIVLASTAVPTT